MPMFPNQEKINTQKVIVEIGIALMWESSFHDDYGLGKGFWSCEGFYDQELRQAFVENTLNPQEHHDYDDDYDYESDYNYTGSHYHY